MRRIELVTQIAAPAQQCFDLSLSVDAHRSSMADSGEQAIGGVTTGLMQLGDTVTWRARHFGIPFTMTSAITEYEAPWRFVDEQQTGLFRRWWHEHRFETFSGGTQMRDVIEFEAPLGPLGRVVETLILTRYMTQLMKQRNSWLAQTLERDEVN